MYPSGSPLTIPDGKSITIDLNGHTIDGKGESQVFYVGYGGTLTLTNSVPESGAVTGGYAEYGGGVCVADGGTFTLAGGSISGNSASGGGGVYVEDDGTFAMTGGGISGNTAEYAGGGVYVSGNGTFTMTGGAISGNDSYWAGGVDACGTFTMTGGEISGNSANSTGGGVYVDWGGAFTMTGGGISGNTAEYAGGGVYVDDGGTFTVSDDPVVSGNTNSVGTANNVYLPNNTKIAVSNLTAGASIGVTTEIMPAESDPVTITTGATAGDSQYFHSDIETLSAVMAEGEVRLERSFYTPWEVLQMQLNAGGVVTLTNDIVARAADATLTVTNAVTLDLGGHTIDAAGRFRVIEIESGGNLTLTNSIPETGTITGGKTYQGGGVCVGRDGAFTMTGGAISGNTASYGGGVYVEDYSTFAMTGGTISGNFGEYGGGGVYVDWDGTFTASGDPLVSGNTNSLGTANNVYLHINRIIAVSNLTAGASLGVTTQTVPSEGSPVTITTGAAAGDSQYFFSDNPAYLAGTAANGQVCLACGIVYPAYLAGADETVTNNWVNWATKYGANTNAAYEVCFLLDISPATAIPHGAALLRVVHFEQTDTGYHFELASDIAELTQPADAGGNRLGNGYIAVDVTAELSGAWCRVEASATVDANGHVIVDLSSGDSFQGVSVF